MDEVGLIVGNRGRIKANWIGTIKLKLESGFCLELGDTIYIPSMRRSLIPFIDLINWVTLFLLGMV